MRVVVVTPPEPLVPLDEAKLHLRVDFDDDDALIEGAIAAVSAAIDGPDGWLGRAIGLQTLEYRGDPFGLDPIRLPCPPLIEVEQVSYLDTTGAEQVVPAASYGWSGAGLAPAWGMIWPTARWTDEAVRVRYTAGYEIVPPAIRAALLLMIGDLYDNRATVETGVRAAAVSIPMSTTVDALLSPFRVYA